jgi:hypothetical protein
VCKRSDENTLWPRVVVWATWLLVACADVLAEPPVTLGVPRGGRVVESAAMSNPDTQAPFRNSLVSDSGIRPMVTLGTPRKSSPASHAAATTPEAIVPNADTPWPATPLPIRLAADHFPSPAPPNQVAVVRGSVDENYLRGVATSTTEPRVRGDLGTAPWDWLSRTVQNSGMEQYCQWFHINTTFQSDHAFDEFISPVTNPFFFEDPRALTELRPVFLLQNTPKSNPLFAGGNIEMFALQARLALNDRLSLVLSKLGFIAFQPDAPSPLGDEIGFAEIVVGPKLTFWRDDAANIIAAFGVNFEIAAGGGNVFQSTGSGSVVPYLTIAKEVLDNLHLMGAIGYRAGLDSDRSDSFFVSLHADYEFYRRIYPFVEVNWFHYTGSGKVLVANFEGGDLFNFGSTGASGEDIVTLGVGVRYKFFGSERYQIGTAFEFPLTKGKDILDWRWTIDFIWRY